MRRYSNGASLTGYGLVVGLISIVALGAVTSSGSNVKSLFETVGGEMETVVSAQGSAASASTPEATPTPIPVLASCNALLVNDPALNDGAYQIDPDGSGGNAAYTVYCDMTTDGGGWTLVSHVFDNDAVDDIPNNPAGAAWGDPNTTPDANSSFNITEAAGPGYTEAKLEWRYPLFSDMYDHPVPVSFMADRWAWSYSDNVVVLTDAQMGNQTVSTGRIIGVFGSLAGGHLRGINHTCAANNPVTDGLHYWGHGGVIGVGNMSGVELHNLPAHLNRADGGSTGCGTRQSILNMWVR